MENSKQCMKCGAQIPFDAVICPVCGANQNPQPNDNQTQYNPNPNPNPNVGAQQPVNPNAKDKTTSLILCILGYVFQIHGLHRFYSGHIGIGIIQLITWGGCGIWTLIDLIQIASGSYRDGDGNPLKG